MKATPINATAAVRADIQRYIEEYQWSWALAKNLINRTHGTQYTARQLRTLYEREHHK